MKSTILRRLFHVGFAMVGLLGACTSDGASDGADASTRATAGTDALGPVPDITPTLPPDLSGSAAPSTPSTVQDTTTTLGLPTVLFVRTGGNDSNSGRDEANALASVQEAVNRFRSGGTIDIGPGTFGVVSVQAVTATEAGPLVLRGAGPDQTWLSSDSYDDDAGVEVIGSEHVILENFGVRASLWGIAIQNSHHLTVRNTMLTDLGQEALSVRDFSSDVAILDNTILGTGRRPGSFDGVSYAMYGEGIYIGTGSGSAKDSVNNIVISGNDISQTTSEAIDLKPFTYDLLVENNLIHDLSTNTSGALVLGVGDDVYRNPNAVIRGNQIWNISRTSPYKDGNGMVLGASAEVYNNVIWSTQHRGIYIDASFANPDERSVLVHHNTVVDTGGSPIEIAAGPLASEAVVVDNIGTAIDGNIEATADLFVDWAASDYRLGPSAVAAIDATVGTAVPETDVLGNERPGGSRADKGAFEFVPTQ